MTPSGPGGAAGNFLIASEASDDSSVDMSVNISPEHGIIGGRVNVRQKSLFSDLALCSPMIAQLSEAIKSWVQYLLIEELFSDVEKAKYSYFVSSFRKKLKMFFVILRFRFRHRTFKSTSNEFIFGPVFRTLILS